jgi:hypothetical protein
LRRSKLPAQLSFLSKLFRSNDGVAQNSGGTELAERLLREQMKVVRSRLRQYPGGQAKRGASATARDKFARAQSRKLMKAVRRKPVGKIDKDVLMARFRPSPILDRLVPNRQINWKPVLKRQPPRKAPTLTLKNFSFLDDPEGTLSALRQIGQLEGSALEAFLHFSDEFCLDAGAYLVLAEVWPHMARIFQGGQMSQPVQKVLNATGVGKHNRMTLRAAERDLKYQIDGRHADVWAFPLQRRRPAYSSRSATVHLDPQTREEAADSFCDAVDEWIGIPEIGQELTDQGKGWIGGIIGELLCNAERHSKPNTDDGDWSTTAFMTRKGKGPDSVLRCYMAFLSVGMSFFESLASAAPDIKAELGRYLQRHWGCGLSPEALATVYALQDTITCDPGAREERSGGTGLQDVLDFVNFLAGPPTPESDTRVSIISGRACIALRYPYLFGTRRAPDQPRLLWCNEANSSNDPPDAKIVSSLAEHFSGTLVSVAFTLDPAYLASLVESEHAGND